MNEHDFDIFVIGAGSAGVRAANLAASSGAKVGIAEEYRFGGTCVIRGCVPKKLMVFAADFYDHFVDSEGFGWSAENVSFSWRDFVSAKDKEIDRLESIYRSNLENNGVQVFSSRATLVSSHKVQLLDGKIFSVKTILIATGGQPFIPSFPGNKHVKTSDQIFDITDLPNRILIVGGGYIASEFASIFNGMGSSVIQIYRGEKILRGFDPDLRSHLMDSMIERGIDLRCSEQIVSIGKVSEGLLVSLSNGESIIADHVLAATGRIPNTINLGLAEIGVKLDNSGAIKVDPFQRSSVSSIYAVGDVTNRLNLTPVAIRDSIAFIETVVNGRPTSPDHEVVPTAVFTRPEIGTVGLNEDEIPEETKVKIYKTKFRPMFNVLANRNERTLMKLVIEEKSRKVLGCHLIGPGSAEMVQLAAIPIKMGATKEDFDRTCAVHPTIAEELVTLK